MALTSAAYTDTARLNASLSTDTLDLAVVDQGVVRTGAGDVVMEVPAAQGLAPGRTVEVLVGVANNSLGIPAAVTARITAEPVVGVPDISDRLLVTVVDEQTGALLLGGAADDPTQGVPVVDPAAVDLGVLTARGAVAQGDGEPYVPGEPGSSRRVVVTLHYPEGPGTEALNGGRATVLLDLDAASTAS